MTKGIVRAPGDLVADSGQNAGRVFSRRLSNDSGSHLVASRARQFFRSSATGERDADLRAKAEGAVRQRTNQNPGDQVSGASIGRLTTLESTALAWPSSRISHNTAA